MTRMTRMTGITQINRRLLARRLRLEALLNLNPLSVPRADTGLGTARPDPEPTRKGPETQSGAGDGAAAARGRAAPRAAAGFGS